MKTATRGPEPERERIAGLALRDHGAVPVADRVARVRADGSLWAASHALGMPSRAYRAAERELEALQARGFEALAWTDPRYPRLLRRIHDPPFVLVERGSLAPEDGLAIAVVGSRRATRYGLELARRLSRELASRGLVVVSGLARGIDASAHRGALEAGGRTIAVLGSGLARLYPSEHRELAERVADRGAVVSELPMDAPPLPGHFPRRNRLITGMTLGTLVVEAAAKSGSLVSARLAMEQDRDVFAVPGPALAPNSEGVHALIRDGAKLVTAAEHVVEELRPELRALLEPAPRASDAAPATPDPATLEGRVYRALADAGGPVHLDAILGPIGEPAPRILAALSALELDGHALRLPGGRYQAAPVRGPGGFASRSEPCGGG